MYSYGHRFYWYRTVLVQLLLGAIAIVMLFNGTPMTWLWVSFTSWFLFYVIGEGIFLHKYFSHGSFKCSPWVAKLGSLLAMFGAFSSPVRYRIVHVAHHVHADTELDPHSPKKNFLSSFFLWQLDEKYSKPSLNPAMRLLVDPFYQYTALNGVKIWYIPVILTALIDWRITLFMCLGSSIGWLFTCCTNVFGHSVGSRRFDTNDSSTNFAWFSWICWQGGCALQNNHHAFPTRKHDSHVWYEFDIGKYLIPLLEKI